VVAKSVDYRRSLGLGKKQGEEKVLRGIAAKIAQFIR